jgi:hypothetical protein
MMNRYQHLSKSECKAELARVTAEATDLLRQAMREDPFETVMYMLDYAAEYDERNPGSTAAILPNFLVDSLRRRGGMMPITDQDQLDQATGLLELFTSTLVELINAVAQGLEPEAQAAASNLIAQHAEAIQQ